PDQLCRQHSGIRRGQRTDPLLAHVGGRYAAERQLLGDQRDERPLTGQLIAHAPDREDVVGQVGPPYRREQRLVARPYRRSHDDDLLRPVEAEVEGLEEGGRRGRGALEDRRKRAQDRIRALAAAVVGRGLGEPQQGRRGDPVPGWRRPVVGRLLPRERYLMVCAREEEAPPLRVPEIAIEHVLEGERLVQPAQLEGRLIEIEEPGGQICVVVEERILVC